MRVVCIKDIIPNVDWAGNPLPAFGSKYTVLEILHRTSHTEYTLVEFGNGYAYFAFNFAPCSNIDETQTEVYKNLQTQPA